MRKKNRLLNLDAIIYQDDDWFKFSLDSTLNIGDSGSIYNSLFDTNSVKSPLLIFSLTANPVSGSNAFSIVLLTVLIKVFS